MTTLIHRVRWVCLLMLLLCAVSVSAQITLLASPNTQKTSLYTHIQQSLAQTSVSQPLLVIVGKIDTRPLDLNQYHGVITIGASPLFERPNVYHLHITPPPEMLVQLSLRILGETTAVILPYRHEFLSESAQRQLADHYPSIKLMPVTRVHDFLSELHGVQGVIALPDSQLYTATNMSAVTRSLYRQRKVLIGFSHALLQSGALATLYLEPDDLSARLQSMIEQLDQSETQPFKQWYPYFQVGVNDTLANTLRIVLPSEASLEEAINLGTQPEGSP